MNRMLFCLQHMVCLSCLVTVLLISPAITTYAEGQNLEASPILSNPGQCGCGTSDIDGDGTPDCNDQCSNDPNKIDPGQCGCGVADTDTDGDNLPDCIDACPNNPTKTAVGICGCGVTETDSDSDGTPDCNDECPNDSSKTNPDQCGCGITDIDTDCDLVVDCNDSCPNDANKITPGQCGCGIADTDTDSDGLSDCKETCPNDANNDADNDGVCGDLDNCPFDSNVEQTDSDNNGKGDACDDRDCDQTYDATDLCPDDPYKTEPGVNGCGQSDADSDGDGISDIYDLCPLDSSKSIPEVCGCNQADSDQDQDGVPDCNDNCPDDPNKTGPGICGCHLSDNDNDNNGISDCNDRHAYDTATTEVDLDGDGVPDCSNACPNTCASLLSVVLTPEVILNEMACSLQNCPDVRLPDDLPAAVRDNWDNLIQALGSDNFQERQAAQATIRAGLEAIIKRFMEGVDQDPDFPPNATQLYCFVYKIQQALGSLIPGQNDLEIKNRLEDLIRDVESFSRQITDARIQISEDITLRAHLEHQWGITQDCSSDIVRAAADTRKGFEEVGCNVLGVYCRCHPNLAPGFPPQLPFNAHIRCSVVTDDNSCRATLSPLGLCPQGYSLKILKLPRREAWGDQTRLVPDEDKIFYCEKNNSKERNTGAINQQSPVHQQSCCLGSECETGGDFDLDGLNNADDSYPSNPINKSTSGSGPEID